MRVDVELHGVDNVLTTLQLLPVEISAKRGGPVRAALRKGAAVIHKQAVANLQAVTLATADVDEKTSTGLLKDNVVVTRGKEPRGSKGERYLVRVRRKVYPGRSGKGTTTLASANLLEYGSSQQPAEPWLRPAFGARAKEAIDVATRHVADAVERLAKKHLKR